MSEAIPLKKYVPRDPSNTLREKLNAEPFKYLSQDAQRRRLKTVIETLGEQIPKIYLAIMFDRADGSITERLGRLFPDRERRAGSALFALWLKQDLVDVLDGLTIDERAYLKSLRTRVIRCYYEERSSDPDLVATEMQQALRKAAVEHGSVKTHVECSNSECPNTFPPIGEFFPNLRHGGKKPGRCAICVYRRKHAQAQRRRANGPSRPKARQLTEQEKTRFWQVEEVLRLKLPTRVLAVLFQTSSTTINNLRKHSLTRTQGKKVYHDFQLRKRRPRFSELTADENQIVVTEWQTIRELSSNPEYASPQAHLAELVEYTRQALEIKPRCRCKICTACETRLVADIYCFPYGRKESPAHVTRKRRGKNRKKVLRNKCRACYS